jgi:hypothetical protein
VAFRRSAFLACQLFGKSAVVIWRIICRNHGATSTSAALAAALTCRWRAASTVKKRCCTGRGAVASIGPMCSRWSPQRMTWRSTAARDWLNCVARCSSFARVLASRLASMRMLRRGWEARGVCTGPSFPRMARAPCASADCAAVGRFCCPRPCPSSLLPFCRRTPRMRFPQQPRGLRPSEPLWSSLVHLLRWAMTIKRVPATDHDSS